MSQLKTVLLFLLFLSASIVLSCNAVKETGGKKQRSIDSYFGSVGDENQNPNNAPAVNINIPVIVIDEDEEENDVSVL